MSDEIRYGFPRTDNLPEMDPSTVDDIYFCPKCKLEHHSNLCPNCAYEHPVRKSGGIQLEIPKNWWIVQRISGEWDLYYEGPKPTLQIDGEEYWHFSQDCIYSNVKVTGFTSDWKDSPHQWNGKEWVKV